MSPVEVYVKKRCNGERDVKGIHAVTISSIRDLPALYGVMFPGETLIEWVRPENVSTTPTQQMELL